MVTLALKPGWKMVFWREARRSGMKAKKTEGGGMLVGGAAWSMGGGVGAEDLVGVED